MSITKIDIKAGDLTFGQRIEIGKIMALKENEIVKFEKIFECLHKIKIKPKEYSKYVGYYGKILEGLIFWVEKENTLLKYEPTTKEKRAGIKQLSTNIGEFGTIKALAKAYNQDPDTILQWKYGKVFGILYTDFEEYKYNLRYSELK